MIEIQRYSTDTADAYEYGYWVKYGDHLADKAAAVEEVANKRDALRKAISQMMSYASTHRPDDACKLVIASGKLALEKK